MSVVTLEIAGRNHSMDLDFNVNFDTNLYTSFKFYFSCYKASNEIWHFKPDPKSVQKTQNVSH